MSSGAVNSRQRSSIQDRISVAGTGGAAPESPHLPNATSTSARTFMGTFMQRLVEGLHRTWRAIIFAVIGSGFVGAALYGCAGNESRIVAELDRLSQGGEPGPTFGRYDYVCVSFDVGRPWLEFADAAASKSIPIATCGVANSCCSVGSDLGGVIGLIKDGAIHCTELKDTVVLPEATRAICAKPSDLIVKRETIVDAGQPIPGRSALSRPRETYYKVMEKRQ
jgi:hypothetical protein